MWKSVVRPIIRKVQAKILVYFLAIVGVIVERAGGVLLR
jgi:hypothetical protein